MPISNRPNGASGNAPPKPSQQGSDDLTAGDDARRRRLLFGSDTPDSQETESAESAKSAEPAAPPASADSATVSQLIDVYFRLEEPSERDALFDELLRHDAPIVTDFLKLMAERDEDEFMRGAATAQLARRGDTDALERLAAYLDDADDPFFFEEAVDVLSDLLGDTFYATLQTIWLDPVRPADQCCYAMRAMESIDAERALSDFVAFIDEIDDLDSLPNDQVEMAAMAFARHDHRAGAEALADLHDRVLASHAGREEDRLAMADWLKIGIGLIMQP